MLCLLRVTYGLAQHINSLKILNLSPPVTKQQIKLRYRQLALKHHPDSGQDTSLNTNKFIQITQAYKNLLEISQQEINAKVQAQPKVVNARLRAQSQRKQKAYQYFKTKKFKPQSMDNKHKLPVLKSVPEFLIGFLLVAIMMGEWCYVLYKKRLNQPQQKANVKQVKDPFKGLNSLKRFRSIQDVGNNANI